MQREKKSVRQPARWGKVWRHLAAASILFWLAWVYLNYYPQFYARFLP